MFSEDVHKKHLEELNKLRMYIDSLEFESRIIKQSELIPIHVLLVAITVDHKERNRFINFSFVPLTDEEIEHIHLLQFYTTLPFEVNMANKEGVEKLLFAVNSRMAVGHFGIQDDGEIYVRYIYTTHQKHGINEEQIIETVLLFIAMIDMHEEMIDLVSNGEFELENALRLLEEP